ncbi:MAG: acetate/propionate family kinase [Armatimonadetes bacterium]|nr:acetate/propionate family kinase [Armatimonadota bacterium]
MLLFDVTPTATAWCYLDGAKRLDGEVAASDDVFQSIKHRLGTLREGVPVGYVLRHGGETVKLPVSLVGPDTLLAIQQCTQFLPEQNDALYRLVRVGLSTLVAVPHVLFCDTAFFLDLPKHVHTYALPLSLANPSLRRYGGFGLCHQWVWNSLQGCLSVPPSAVVSVYLGECPNIAAIRDGKPVETTIGFTPVEGISSARSCGDIDPTIVFQIHATGFGFREISRLLTEQSGYSALLGRDCTMRDVAQDRSQNPILSEAREFYIYQIKKYVGAFVSVLGGVDAIAFVSEDMPSYSGLIRSLCGELGFLPIRTTAQPTASGPVLRLTQKDSHVQVCSLSYDKWEALYQAGTAYLKS